MTDRPILFSAPMIRAILEGRKTQTRRILKITPPDNWNPVVGRYNPTVIDRRGVEQPGAECFGASDESYGCKIRWAPGDRLWVRETWARNDDMPTGTPHGAVYKADPGHDHDVSKWTPSIYMPRWASRITLEVTEVRVQRVQEISEEDAIAEGLITQEGDGGGAGAGFKWNGTGYHGGTRGKWGMCFHVAAANGLCSCKVGGPSPSQCAYRELWESINGADSWNANPWVAAITFRRLP